MSENDAPTTPDEAGPPRAEGQPVGAHYRAFELLGSGAMGEVRRGVSSTGEPVAIKLLHPGLAGTPGLVARFVNERNVLTGLAGPNLVRVRDLVADGPLLAIVMDLVSGGDLRRHLTAAGTLAPAEAAALVAGVLNGLETVHRAGVVHRDVKPENVLLDTAPGAPPVPKVADFGVSKITTGLSSGQTSIIGTPVYMAPELLDGEPTPSSDLYAVGVLLYELLCGVPPFASGNPLTLMRQHTEASPGRPPGVPDDLWAVIADMLAKDPAARPPSAGAVAAHLQLIAPRLAGLPAAERLPAAPVAEGATVLTTPATRPVVAAAATPAAPRKSRRGLLVGTAAVAVLAMAGGGAAMALNAQKDSAPATSAVADERESADDVAEPVALATQEPEPSASAPASEPSPSAALVVGPTGILPDLVGLPLKEAVAELSSRGLKFTTEDVVGTGKPEGTVVSTTPTAGQPAGDLIVVRVARSARSTYLADVPPVESEFRPFVVSISGKEYTHGMYEQLGDYSCTGDVSSASFDLGRQSSRLTGVVGLTDDSDAARVVQLEVLGDDRLLKKVSVSLGKPQQLDVDVSGVLRLVLRHTTTACDEYDDDSFLALGDPTLLGLPNAGPS